MPKNLLDTNLINRFLVNDDRQKASRVEKLLKSNHNQNILLDTVIAEIIWVLNSYYELSKTEIVEKIKALIQVDSIECNDFLINRALSIWEENNISYIDSYIGAVGQLGKLIIYSYDQKIKKIPNLTVKEP